MQIGENIITIISAPAMHTTAIIPFIGMTAYAGM
jgi:hypothetical protein